MSHINQPANSTTNNAGAARTRSSHRQFVEGLQMQSIATFCNRKPWAKPFIVATASGGVYGAVAR